MLKRFSWILAVILTLTVVMVAQAALSNKNFLPLISRNLPTSTPTGTATKTPTPTRTPTPGPCLNKKTKDVCFTAIEYAPANNPLNEWVTIKNFDTKALNMSLWGINSDSNSGSGNSRFLLPSSFTLNANATVKVWTKTGKNTGSELFMNRTVQFWQDRQDCGYLLRPDKNSPNGFSKVDSFCYNATTNTFYEPPEDQWPALP